MSESSTATSALIQLIYVSNSAYFEKPEELEELLRISRKNNAALGITGMLLFHDGIFFQILEGPEDAVKKLYEKVKTNPKHRACRILATVDIEQKEFANWSMGYEKPEGKLALGFSDFMSNYMSYDPARTQSEAYKLMLKFRDRALKTKLAS